MREEPKTGTAGIWIGGVAFAEWLVHMESPGLGWQEWGGCRPGLKGTNRAEEED